ncbi:hypothetical protein [Endozoicomonas sp. SCSIO W0465]|uniref:hypothetical protein n=1 Tax=Endozoicomonas sp. SCSIO W0465 TaxID=2918516 RepID=UPI002075A8C2|nr:hypothetical protein [Endozoicomonas sp. SCSIO W0465]USE36015.1 hypothetical protein MJO57_28835 [Endozoicomonas sp. SCSIO W0465]
MLELSPSAFSIKKNDQSRMDYRRKTIRLLALEDSPNDVERWVKLFRNAGVAPRVQHISFHRNHGGSPAKTAMGCRA